ncbi:MAG TPA: P-loop NTPase fold protein, partial [Polyangiaceae bacterium]|nr:P-loop NTPase fold protein [Polyangiaceae bacterium]
GGHGYLEKIVQVPFELPVPDPEQLDQMLFKRLDQALGSVPGTDLDQRRWAGIYQDSIRPFVVKPRDVVRLANALGVTYAAVRGDVKPVDFIAVEAWRVLEPRLYSIVRDNPDRFAGMLDTRGSRANTEKEEDKKFHDMWTQGAADRADAYRQATRRVFPRLEALWGNRYENGQAWRHELRVCSADVFPVYFRLSVSPHSISKAELQAVLDLGKDPEHFGHRVLELGGQRRPDGTSRARVFLDRLNEELRQRNPSRISASPMLRAFARIADALVQAEGPPRGFDFGISTQIQAAIDNLIGLIPANERFEVLTAVCSTGEALEQIADTVSLLGGEHGRHGEQPESEDGRLLTEREIVGLEGLIGGRLAQLAATGGIWGMHRPLRALFHWRHFEGTSPVDGWIRSLTDPELLRLLRLFVREQHTLRSDRELRLEGEDFDNFFATSDIVSRIRPLLDSLVIPSDRAIVELVLEHLESAQGAPALAPNDHSSKPTPLSE